jgi:hypothetical protein
MTDIIFIGAGPIGLLGAIQLKLQCPTISILMFEKYEVPLRKHAMYVDKSSFAGMDRSRGFGEILDGIPAKVIISDLEVTLRAYACSLGIQIQYQEIKDVNELKKHYPNTQYFIGSGGLRGVVHPQIFNNENQINETLRYAVEVKYKAVGEARSLNKLTEIPGVIAHTKHLVSEYVGHLKNGDEQSYRAMEGATFKAPYTLADEDKIPPDLFTTITNYITGRHHIAVEQMQEGSLTISALTLSIYASREFCKQDAGKTVFQIGEEAFACPFYRSFNDNASCIPAFSTAMKALFENSMVTAKKSSSSSIYKVSSYEEQPLDYYRRRVQGLVNSEIRTIHVLNFGIDVLESSAVSTQAVPQVSVSKLRLKEGGRSFLNEMKREEPQSSGYGSCVLL